MDDRDDTDIRRAIAGLAADHDFPLAAIREAGEVLVLVPEALEGLPDAQTLRALAGAIQEDEAVDHRYVTFESAVSPEEATS